MKKKLVACLMGLTIAACGGAVLAGCGEKETNQPNEFEKVYSLYVANAAESGETPLSYSEWLDSIKGEKGDKGDKGDAGKDGTNGTNGTDGKDGTNGTDGVTPHIGANGNWYIGDTDTGIKAAGTDGTDGAKGDKGDKGDAGTNGTNGTDGTNGTNGTDGVTPHIGTNGNWYIGDADTGIKAAGTDGTDGAKGDKGDKGDAGKDGTNGTNGKDGISITDVTVTYTMENNIPYMVFTFYFSEGEPVVQKIALEQPTQDQVVDICFELDEYQVGTPADQIYLIVQYSQSGEQRISLAELAGNINGDYDLNAIGSYNITVEIEGYSQQLTLNIVGQQTDEIENIWFESGEYQVGTYAKEIYLIVQYSQSGQQKISLAELAGNITGEYDLNASGSYKITVEYEGCSQPLTLNIVEQVADTVRGIYLDNNTNNEYLVGTSAEEIYFIVQYSQSEDQRRSLAELADNITGEYDLNASGSYNIKVEYDNFTAYLTLNIVEDYTARLSLNDNNIVWFDDIAEDNLKYLRATYQKGEVREEVQLTSDMLSELPGVGGMGEVTVSYLGEESTIWVQRIAEPRDEYIANNSATLNGYYESQGNYDKQIKLGDEVFTSDDYIRVTNENGYTFFIQPTVDMLFDTNTQEAPTLNVAGNYGVDFDQNIVGFKVFGNFMIEVFDMADATIEETLTFSETLADTIGLRSIELYDNGYGIITFSYAGYGYVSYSYDGQIYTVNFYEMDMLLTIDTNTSELVPCEVVVSEKVDTFTELNSNLTLTVGDEYIKVELGQIHVFTLPKSAIYDTNRIKIANMILQLNEDGTATIIGGY